MTNTKVNPADQIPVALVLNLIQLAHCHDIDIRTATQCIDMPNSLHGSKDIGIDSSVFFDIIRIISNTHHNNSLSLQYGEGLYLENFPEFNVFLKTCGSIKSAIKVLEWINPLIFSGLTLETYKTDRCFKIRCTCDSTISDQLSKFIIESFFSSLHCAGKSLLGSKYSVKCIRFSHYIDCSPVIYRRHFGCNVEAGCNQSEMCFDINMLEQKIPGSLPTVCVESEKTIVEKINQQSADMSFIAQLKNHLISVPFDPEKNLNSASAYFDINPRTVQRRLHEHGTTFTELQAEAKSTLAKELLKDRSKSLEYIRETLSFSDRRSFTRAFNKWEGITPREYRKRYTGTSNERHNIPAL